jgi:hypothetical protein
MEKAFFDNISSFYDDMIGFDAALGRRAAVLQKFTSSGNGVCCGYRMRNRFGFYLSFESWDLK